MSRYSSDTAVPYGEGEGKSKRIRCRHCGQRALSNLVICPHCGRELHPAPSRLLMWGVPVALVALFLLILFNWSSTSPITGAQELISRGLNQLTQLSAQMEPGSRRVYRQCNDARDP